MRVRGGPFDRTDQYLKDFLPFEGGRQDSHPLVLSVGRTTVVDDLFLMGKEGTVSEE